MSHLLRPHAPVTEAAWAQIDEQARQTLVPALAARRLVDFSGPQGWEHSAVNLGRTERVGAPCEGLEARRRRVQPIVELRGTFTVGREELDDAGRGATDLDLDGLRQLARRMAEAENRAVLLGWTEAGMAGVAAASEHAPLPLGPAVGGYPDAVARAVATLLGAGVAGPFGLALGPEAYTGVMETTEGGSLVVRDHLREILGGPVVWAPGLTGAVVVSQRGGDVELCCGQDLSVGYDHHDADGVTFTLEESFTVVVRSPEAGLALEA